MTDGLDLFKRSQKKSFSAFRSATQVTRMTEKKTLDALINQAPVEMQLAAIFPERRGDPEFAALLIDTLKLDRPAYRELHAFATSRGWPTGA